MTAITLSRQTNRFRIVQMLLGGIFGGLFGYTTITFIRHIGFNVKALSLIDLIGLCTAVALFGIGLIIFAISFSARWAGRQLEQAPEAPPATRKELSLLRLQAIVVILAGLLLAAPLFASISPVGVRNKELIFAAIATVFVMQSAFNLLIWNRADEFVRRMMAQISMISFWALQGALFLAAAAEKLGLLHGVSLWTASICSLSFYLVVSLIMTVRCVRF